ncbi:hypothetical protein BDP27DRAFT_1368703 [Rhodocollybia butyracea]|uniref:Uncharacterized protein n=1 Tax=Rhodocollybia butyracea TaxID=206335 RepID=A0A9P5PIA8_9AGAR|nr:hypothetical protein BDP27DRAFT_1368703 [Rhodocollybia butyracea]
MARKPPAKSSGSNAQSSPLQSAIESPEKTRIPLVQPTSRSSKPESRGKSKGNMKKGRQSRPELCFTDLAFGDRKSLRPFGDRKSLRPFVMAARWTVLAIDLYLDVSAIEATVLASQSDNFDIGDSDIENTFPKFRRGPGTKISPVVLILLMNITPPKLRVEIFDYVAVQRCETRQKTKVGHGQNHLTTLLFLYIQHRESLFKDTNFSRKAVNSEVHVWIACSSLLLALHSLPVTLGTTTTMTSATWNSTQKEGGHSRAAQ